MSSGSDAPPDTATRNADWSRPSMSCWAGVQHGRHTPITVHRSASIASSTAAGWKRDPPGRRWFPPFRPDRRPCLRLGRAVIAIEALLRGLGLLHRTPVTAGLREP